VGDIILPNQVTELVFLKQVSGYQARSNYYKDHQLPSGAAAFLAVSNCRTAGQLFYLLVEHFICDSILLLIFNVT
jgi:hypothetical protein